MLNSTSQSVSTALSTVNFCWTAARACRSLSHALRRLKALGIWVDDVNIRGNFAFVAQIGSPDKTLYVKAIDGISQPNSRLRVAVTG